MECIHIGSKIITVAIQMHGRVINLNLSHDTNTIFEDLRLFSITGDFEDVVSTPIQEFTILNKINELFQKDLSKPTLDLLSQYVIYSKQKYKNVLGYFNKLNAKNAKNICRQFNSITYDKLLSDGDETDYDTIFGRIGCFINRLLPVSISNKQGIYIISVHEKKDENNYELVYPKLETDKQNLNLLLLNDFRRFAEIFETQIPDLRDVSTNLPSAKLFIDSDKTIENDETLTLEEKQIRLQALKDHFFRLLSEWKLTLRDNKITTIKLSVIISLIKDIVGPSCKINLFDFSCNSISTFVPKPQLLNTQFMLSPDINDPETGISRHWGGDLGGKKSKKKSTKRKKYIKKKKGTKRRK